MRLIVAKAQGEKYLQKIKIAKEEIKFPIKNCINKHIPSSTFPDELKTTDIEPPVYKKCVKTKQEKPLASSLQVNY